MSPEETKEFKNLLRELEAEKLNCSKLREESNKLKADCQRLGDNIIRLISENSEPNKLREKHCDELRKQATASYYAGYEASIKKI